MYCTQCAASNDDGATTCSSCGARLFKPGAPISPYAPPATPAAETTVPNYLVQSILVTLCCCQIPGIVAIVYSAQVNGLLKAGDVPAALRASRLAYIWAWVAFGLGATFGLAYVLFMLFTGVFAR